MATTMRKALVTLGKSFYEAYPPFLSQLEDTGLSAYAIVDSDYPVSKERILEHITDAEILIVGVETIDREVINSAPSLRYISRYGAGVDNIDLEAAARSNIIVSNVPGQNSDAVADLTIGLMIAVLRKIPFADASLKAGGWQLLVGSELKGKTVGIVGFGSIGHRVARRLSGFDAEILVYDEYKEDDASAKRLDITYTSLDDLLRRSDIVSLHVPLTATTRGLINMSRLELMKRSALLINTSRGPVIAERDLVEALRNGTIRGAGLDVFTSEPPSEDILSLDNTVLTPHIGGATYECARRLGQATIENVRRYIAGEKPVSILTGK